MSNVTSSDYIFVENDSEDFYGVKLKGGMWPEVVVVYGTVSIKESPELGVATLSFSYSVEDSNKFSAEDLKSCESFKNHLGDVLTHIIDSKAEQHIGS